MGSTLSQYDGITHAVPFRLLHAWKRLFCRVNIHAFDEVAGGPDHYLSCDACGLVVNIASIDRSYVNGGQAGRTCRDPAVREAHSRGQRQ